MSLDLECHRHRYRPPPRQQPGRGAPTVIASRSATARLPVPRRIPNEFYPTPPEATRALLSVETFDDAIWEPACGDGAIARELAATGHRVVSTDLHPYGFGDTGVDFLTEASARAKHIVTNPPYGNGLADAFLLKALALTRSTGGKTALLLNLSSLCHPRRTPLWQRFPPARLYAVDGIVAGPHIATGRRRSPSPGTDMSGPSGVRIIRARRRSAGYRLGILHETIQALAAG